jgi:hypothetical protein
VETGTVVLMAIAVAAGGLVQGLTGLGFALVSAPIVTQLVSGTGGVGLVNALSIVQNIWLIARTEGTIAWGEIRRMLPGLAIGVLLGWLVLGTSDPAGPYTTSPSPRVPSPRRCGCSQGATPHDPSGDDAEERIDEVEPRPWGRGDVQRDAGVLLKPSNRLRRPCRWHIRRLRSGEFAGVLPRDRRHEPRELVVAVPVVELVVNLPGCDFQCRKRFMVPCRTGRGRASAAAPVASAG